MLKKQQGDDVTEYVPIVKTLLTMDESTEVKLKHKFILLTSLSRTMNGTELS